MVEKATHRLTKDQRAELLRRGLAGERAADLAKEFAVTTSYVNMLKNEARNPERFTLKAEKKLIRKLTKEQLAKFTETLATSTPEDHDLIPTSEKWSLDHGFQLAWKLFQKRPSVRTVKEAVTPFMPRREDFRFTKPKPPKPHHINQISPELAKDPEYVAYYLSPICEQIAWREYEFALADWNARFADAEEREIETAKQREQLESGGSDPPPVLVPGKRVGKHAKSKGSPFTPPKRRKKRR
jgi:hypothetical protein